MKIFKTLLVLSTITVSGQILANEKGMDVIYGDDNRKDVFESRDSAMVELSRSTAAQISGTDLKMMSNGEVSISGQTLKDRGVCASERFAGQITAANCSGFLVGENILVTAGHCIRSQSDCSSWKWVFDYKVENADQRNVSVSPSNIYSCKRIVDTVLDQTTKNDYAVIELDRKVTDRRPLAFRRTGKITPGTAVTVIGHPTGLPTKIADMAKVRSLAPKFFVANLDTYGGNSGSAVFNSKTGEVEGILVRGETDYVYDSAKGCQVSNKCPSEGCRGEDVTYITNIEALRNIR